MKEIGVKCWKKCDSSIYNRLSDAVSQSLKLKMCIIHTLFWNCFVLNYTDKTTCTLESIIREEDLTQYNAKIEEPLKVTMKDGSVLYSPRPPASGAVLSFILDILDGGLSFVLAAVGAIESPVLNIIRMLCSNWFDCVIITIFWFNYIQTQFHSVICWQVIIWLPKALKPKSHALLLIIEWLRLLNLRMPKDQSSEIQHLFQMSQRYVQVFWCDCLRF